MADKELWTTFEKSGSVIDYLNYKGILRDEKKQKLGESAVESVGNSDRDGIVRNTHR